MTPLPKNDWYEKLKEYEWTYNNHTWDLYTLAKISHDKRIIFSVNDSLFALDSFVIKDSDSAEAMFTGHRGGMPSLFKFIGKKIDQS